MKIVFVVTRLAARGESPEIVGVYQNEDTASKFCENMNVLVKNGYYYQYDTYEYNTI
jgi:hypothetical protein